MGRRKRAVDELTINHIVDEMTVDDLTVDELTLDDLTWYLFDTEQKETNTLALLDEEIRKVSCGEEIVH